MTITYHRSAWHCVFIDRLVVYSKPSLDGVVEKLGPTFYMPIGVMDHLRFQAIGLSARPNLTKKQQYKGITHRGVRTHHILFLMRAFTITTGVS